MKNRIRMIRGAVAAVMFSVWHVPGALAEEATFAPAFNLDEQEVMIRASRQSPPLLTAIDFHSRRLYLINYRTDKLITVDPRTIPNWPGDLALQHTIASASGHKLIITTDSSETEPARAIELDVLELSWETNHVQLQVANVYTLTEIDAAPTFPFVKSVNSRQNVPQWTLPTVRQIHGPTLLPKSNLVYLTDWTKDEVRVLDVGSGTLADFDPLSFPGYTEQTHGIMFNKSGTFGLGTGYFYDDPYIDLYSVNQQGAISPVSKLMLGKDSSYAAFTHYISWLDNRYAVTASMQLDKTSLTPQSVDSLIGPSVWLIDAWSKTTTKILNSTDSKGGAGVFRSASDLVVAGGKLFIAEEDTLDHTFANDGYISIFSMETPLQPRFITRLRPGIELPADFTVAHALTVTPDERFVYVASWVSGYIVKIDVAKNAVVKVFGPKDGLVMPHGVFVSGGIR